MQRQGNPGMALSDFTGPDYIDAWARDLDARWPERKAMGDCVVDTLVEWSVARPIGGSTDERTPAKIRLLELGIGAGGLGLAVLEGLTAAQRFENRSKTRPTGSVTESSIEYTGVDIESALVGHVRERLGSAGYPHTLLVQADLKDSGWSEHTGHANAVFSLQTFHDLGGIVALEAVYSQIHGLLLPGGILVNADFVVPFEKDDPDRPRRLPVETHRDLLAGLGFVEFRCVKQQGKIACMMARRP